MNDREAAARIAAVRERCRADLRFFAFQYVQTKDPHDKQNPRKPFPHLAYLDYTLEQFQFGPKLQYIAKSRQLMLSWGLAIVGLWTAQFRPLSTVLFQSKKEEDAATMVYEKAPLQGRMSFILANLPRYLFGCFNDRGEWVEFGEHDSFFKACASFGRLSLPNGSEVRALAQGAEQVESRVPTLFLNDEASLQEEWASAQAAAQPAIDGDARGITVGTMRLPSDYGDEIACCDEINPDLVMRGVSTFTSLSGVAGLRIHYSADPHKDPRTAEGQAWKDRQLGSGAYQGGEAGWRWQQHMEINPKSRSGEIVLPPACDERAWKRIQHPTLTYEQMIERRWVFDAGMDYGARNLTVWSVFAMSPEGKRYMVHEIAHPAKEVGGIPGFCRLMKEGDAAKLLKHVNGRIWADPTICHNHDQNTPGGLVTKSDLFAQNGVFLQPAPSKGADADDIFLGRLLGYYWQGWEDEYFEPLFQIFTCCRATLERFPLLRWADWSEAIRQAKESKEAMEQKYADPWDAAKYAESGWPEIPRYSAPAPQGSLAYYVRKARLLDQQQDSIYASSGRTKGESHA